MLHFSLQHHQLWPRTRWSTHHPLPTLINHIYWPWMLVITNRSVLCSTGDDTVQVNTWASQHCNWLRYLQSAVCFVWSTVWCCYQHTSRSLSLCVNSNTAQNLLSYPSTHICSLSHFFFIPRLTNFPHSSSVTGRGNTLTVFGEKFKFGEKCDFLEFIVAKRSNLWYFKKLIQNSNGAQSRSIK